jgi:hypothetical protein
VFCDFLFVQHAAPLGVCDTSPQETAEEEFMLEAAARAFDSLRGFCLLLTPLPGDFQ